MTLNIDPASTIRDGKTVRARGRTPHGALVLEVVDEMTAWNPREFVAAFQRWHAGQLSIIQLNVLALLEATGPLPMSRLAESLDLAVASLTGIVDRMEARRLVERRRDSVDRRVVLVAPGPASRKVFADINQRRRRGLAKLLAGLQDDELRGLLAGHRALRAARAELARALLPDKRAAK